MSDVVKEVIVQRAKHFLELRQAESQLAELERQEQAEAQRQQAEETATQAQQDFNQILADFQASKMESDSAILAWVNEGVRLIERRHTLRGQSDRVAEAARSLAHALLSTGQGNPALRGFGRSDAIRMQSEEILTRTTGHAQLMTLPAGDDRTGYLLNSFCLVTGDRMITQSK